MSLLFPRASRSLSSELGGVPQLFRALDDAFFNQVGAASNQRSFSPRVDLVETSNAFEIKADVPGVARENIEIALDDDNTLTIHGRMEKSTQYGSPEVLSEAHEGKSSGKDGKESNVKELARAENGQQTSLAQGGRRVWQSERMFGEFSRSFSFPTPINKDAIKASLKDGILSVTVPKCRTRKRFGKSMLAI